MHTESNLNSPIEDYLKKIISEVVRCEIEKFVAEVKQNNNEEQDLVFIDEACKITVYKKQTIYGYVNNNKMPYHTKNGKERLAFSRKALIAWREGRN